MSDASPRPPEAPDDAWRAYDQYWRAHELRANTDLKATTLLVGIATIWAALNSDSLFGGVDHRLIQFIELALALAGLSVALSWRSRRSRYLMWEVYWLEAAGELEAGGPKGAFSRAREFGLSEIYGAWVAVLVFAILTPWAIYTLIAELCRSAG